MGKVFIFRVILAFLLGFSYPASTKTLDMGDGVSINSPDGTPYHPVISQVETMSAYVVSSAQQKNKLIYRGKITNSNTYCNYNDPSYKSQKDIYWMEVKYYDFINNNYLSKYFNKPKLYIGNKSIDGVTPNQRVSVGPNGDIFYRLEITLRDDIIYDSSVSEIAVKAGQKIGVMSFFCTAGRAADGDFLDYLSLYNAFTGFNVIAGNDASIYLNRTCTLASPTNLVVPLTPAKRSDFSNSAREIKGGTFSLNLNCSDAQIKNIFIAASDNLNSSNTTNYLDIKKGDGYATGVRILVKDAESKELLKYGQLPTDNIFLNTSGSTPVYPNLIKIGNRSSGDSFISHTYDVYYFKWIGELTPGKVEAQMIYNLYYN
ncbi:fimbrial protein [Escherichia coli]|nr:fimbrial protein [Escherichia coli]